MILQFLKGNLTSVDFLIPQSHASIFWVVIWLCFFFLFLHVVKSFLVDYNAISLSLSIWYLKYSTHHLKLSAYWLALNSLFSKTSHLYIVPFFKTIYVLT